MKLDLEPRLPTEGGIGRLLTRLHEVLRLVAQANNRRADGYVMAGQSVATNYVMQQGDSVLFVSAAGGARTITLPAAAAAAGKLIVVRKTENSANAVTLTPAAGLIDNAASKNLTAAAPAARLVSDGNDYFTV